MLVGKIQIANITYALKQIHSICIVASTGYGW